MEKFKPQGLYYKTLLHIYIIVVLLVYGFITVSHFQLYISIFQKRKYAKFSATGLYYKTLMQICNILELLVYRHIAVNNFQA